jgi:metal-responsive CopG/Arc/MetJ family transcriptional regulator
MPEEKQLVHMLFEKRLLNRLDEFRFKQRFESRTDAIRWLLDSALSQKLPANGGLARNAKA